MQTRRFGRTNLDLSILTFGCGAVGGTVARDWFFTPWGHHQVGIEGRLDALKDVGLSDVSTGGDERNNGDADLYTGALFYRNQYQWNSWLRHEIGVRFERAFQQGGGA